MAYNDLTNVPTDHLLSQLVPPGGGPAGGSPATAQAGPGTGLESTSTDDLLKALPLAPAAAPQAPDPTEGMSTWQRFMAGAGKAVADTGRGLGQFLGLVSQGDVDEAARRDQALMNTGAGVAGDVAGQVAQMAVGGAALKAVPAAAAVAKAAGPFTSALAAGGIYAGAQPVLSGDTRVGNAAEGAALGLAGQAIAGGVARAAAGASDVLTPQVKALYQKAVEAGIPVNAAQLSDSRFVKALASQLERLPFTGATEARQAQQQAFNRAVARTMGEDADAITPDVYAAAKARIGADFEALTARNALNVDMPLLTRLSGVVDEANRFGAADTSNAVRNLVDDVVSKVDVNGMLHGRAYQAMDSQLGQLMKTGGEKAHYLGQLREALRDAMDRNISATDADAWSTARGQWRALKTVRDLAAKDPNGNISPGQLAGRVGASNAGKEALASGTAGELGDLAAIGKQFVRDPVPDSGTSQRLLAQALLTGAVGGGAYAADKDPVTAATAAGASLLGGKALTRVLNSPAAARYMVQGAGPVARAGADAAQVLPQVLPAAGDALIQRRGPTPQQQHFADGGAVTYRGYPAAAKARHDAGIEADIVPAGDGGFILRPRAQRLADGGQIDPATAIDAQAHQAASSPLNDLPEPTQAQAEAGNYKKGHLGMHGLYVSIENPVGSTRRGTDPDGTPWESTIQGGHYGYIRGTKGADGDHLDVFVGPNPESKTVHVVDQVKPDGSFDEHKVLMAYPDAESAKSAYLSNYPAGWQGLGAMSSMPVAAFRAWARSGKRLNQPLG